MTNFDIRQIIHISYFSLRTSNTRKHMILARLIFLHALPFYGVVHIQTVWLAGNIVFTCESRGYAVEKTTKLCYNSMTFCL